MGFLDQVRGWLHREKADVSDAWRETERRLDADLSRKERQLTESPTEGLKRIQEEIGASPDPLEEIRGRVTGQDPPSA